MAYTVKRHVITGFKTVETVIKKLEDWKQVSFQSASYATEEWKAFARMYRARMKKEAAAAGLELVRWSNNHFYCSGFFKNPSTGKLAYFSCADVRFFPNSWADNILIRTAAHDRDYTGGPNNCARLETFGAQLARLTA